MGTFDVVLPAAQAVVFPARCVACEKPNPNNVVKLSILGIKTAPLMTMAVDKAVLDSVDPKYYGSNTSNKIEGIPACKSCASSLKWYHRRLKFGYYTGWLPGVGLIFWGIPTWLSVAVVVLGACAPGILTLMFPPSFGASFIDDRANFEFKSKLVAEEFLALNADASLKKEKQKEPVAA